MEWTATGSTEIRGTLDVRITPGQFPQIAQRCQGDPEFQQLIADNLERVIEEYLHAAEEQIAKMAANPPTE